MLPLPAPREFRARFCDIAERLAWTPPGKLPREVSDCSSLLRYCFLQASGLRGNVFELGEGKTGEFADAEHLMRWNCRSVSQEMVSAQPADLLFFRQLVPRQPWHAMIFLGRSRFETGPENYLVYHTGPDGRDAGGIRRPTVRELLEHPEPRWRPVPGNRNFLGVFRWNILS